ncbi:nucleotidyltransferase family protein [Sediminibacillus massiliensis]|uniref:nucleotidyltransferase family protein n=1 Tax=Sediminibacillus massiliensis TaxID=1926277 RepID=UPI0009885D31|nr:nucleotidyltransferase family protein [Sediminibacillus massiliensis]
MDEERKDETVIEKLINILYDSEKELPSNHDFYHQVLEEVEVGFVSSQIYHLLKKQDRLKETPSFFQDSLKQQFQTVLYQNMIIKTETERILKLLESKRIAVMPIKGVYFSEKYYGNIGARETSDIDLLIKEEDYDMVVSAVKELGFIHEEEFIPGHFHTSFSKDIPGSAIPLTVELHWSILKDNTSNLSMEEFWRDSHSIGNYQYVKSLSDYHTFYLICLHGWRHNLDAPKYFLDIIQMAFYIGKQLDYERLMKDGKTHQTRRRLQRTLAIVYREYPVLYAIRDFSPDKINRYWKKRKSKWKRINGYAVFFDYQFFSYDKPSHGFIEFFHWLFPQKPEILAEISNHTDRDKRYAFLLLLLYKKRCTGALKSIFI